MGSQKRKWEEYVETHREELDEHFIEDQEIEFKRWIDDEKLEDLKVEFIDTHQEAFDKFTLEECDDISGGE